MSFDVAVVGAGPGGYVCAIRAAQLGMSVAIIESRDTLGGTCLNVGCIPSKALLHASHAYQEAKDHFPDVGVKVGRVTVDFDQMQAYKAAQVEALTTGVAFLMKKNKIEWVRGRAKLAGSGRLEVVAEDGTTRPVEAKHIVLATGSEPATIPNVEIDEKQIVSSTGALALDSIPKSVAVIGGGVIGLELGSVWHRLGAEVTVYEYLDEILPGMDGEIAKTFRRELSKQGIQFRLGVAVREVKRMKVSASVRYSKRDDDKVEKERADVVLVATGRRPCTDGLGAAEAGLKLDDAGRVVVDQHWQTSVTGVYAIGDVIDGPMLAHKAEDEGIAVAEIIAGQAGHVNLGLIPSVVYTAPEIAAVGRTEEELKAAGTAYVVGKFPFSANARAKSRNATAGFAKVLADKATDRILGVHVIGPDAGELIHEYCVAMEFGAAAEDVARTCHAHPTLSEAMREAALAVGSGAIHA